MPAFIKPELCDGCTGRGGPACAAICPSDVLRVEADAGKAVNIDPDHCWECYACVKACPTGAIGVSGFAQIMPMGGSLRPVREGHEIVWAIQFRNGKTKDLRFPARTRPAPVGSPFAGLPLPQEADLRRPTLCHHD